MDGQKAHEKMLSIAGHQGNANQNNNDTSSYSCQKGCHQKERKGQILAGIWRKGNTYTLLVECELGKLWKTVKSVFKKLKIGLPYKSGIPLRVI